MQVSEEQVKAIVENVLRKLAGAGPSVATPEKEEAPIAAGEGIVADIDEAMRRARRAQEELVAQTLEKRVGMIAAIRETVRKNVELISKAALEETGMGRVEDKIKKNLLVARATPGIEDIPPTTYTGDHGLTLVERAPYGVIAAITPCTNPTETIICNGIGMIETLLGPEGRVNTAQYHSDTPAPEMIGDCVCPLRRSCYGASRQC